MERTSPRAKTSRMQSTAWRMYHSHRHPQDRLDSAFYLPTPSRRMREGTLIRKVLEWWFAAVVSCGGRSLIVTRSWSPVLHVLTFQGRILGKASYLLPGHCSGCVVSRLTWYVDCSRMVCIVRPGCSSMKSIRLLGCILEKRELWGYCLEPIFGAPLWSQGPT
jgi:hypothetical protein